MDIKAFETSLNDLQTTTLSSFEGAQTYAELRVCLQFCMKKGGPFDAVIALLRGVAPADRPVAGEKLNELKRTIEEAYRARAHQLVVVGLGEQL
jgi:Zn-dependent oligopeptidase